MMNHARHARDKYQQFTQNTELYGEEDGHVINALNEREDEAGKGLYEEDDSAGKALYEDNRFGQLKISNKRPCIIGY